MSGPRFVIPRDDERLTLMAALGTLPATSGKPFALHYLADPTNDRLDRPPTYPWGP